MSNQWDESDLIFTTMANGTDGAPASNGGGNDGNAVEPAVSANQSVIAVKGVTKLAEVPGQTNTTEVGVAYQPIPSEIDLGSLSGSFVFRHLLVAHSSLELNSSAPWQRAMDELVLYTARHATTDTSLIDLHTAAWANIWRGGVEVTGNLTVAAAVNSSLYYVYSAVREDWPYGSSPGGLAVDSYDGRSFWDVETWMFPTMDLFRPALGKALLQYRLDRLPAARTRAIEYGFTGAMFPWTSTLSGVDDTSGELGHMEQHITGDIAMAFRQHWRATGDVAHLREAWPLLRDACTFWHGRAEVTSWSGGNYTVAGATGPDESSGTVDGDAYTVAIMATTLDFCHEAAAALGNASMAPADWATVAATPFLALADDLDPKGGVPTGTTVHLQYHNWPKGGKQITQSSVALLQYPLQQPMPRDLAVADLRYYENQTRQNGFFTGDSIYSIAWLALGEREAADRQWQAAFSHMDLGGFNLWRETLTGGHSNFITGAGGFLQNVVNGYGGLRVLSGSRLQLRPSLPLWGVTRLALRAFCFVGRRLHVGWSATELSVRVEPVRQSLGSSQEPGGGGNAIGEMAAAVAGAAAACGWVVDAAGANHTLVEGAELTLTTNWQSAVVGVYPAPQALRSAGCY
jgi:trehalose/maltose hydrolase-like predicted phosphorylase